MGESNAYERTARRASVEGATGEHAGFRLTVCYWSWSRLALSGIFQRYVGSPYEQRRFERGFFVFTSRPHDSRGARSQGCLTADMAFPIIGACSFAIVLILGGVANPDELAFDRLQLAGLQTAGYSRLRCAHSRSRRAQRVPVSI